jgi:hypothetical protein
MSEHLPCHLFHCGSWAKAILQFEILDLVRERLLCNCWDNKALEELGAEWGTWSFCSDQGNLSSELSAQPCRTIFTNGIASQDTSSLAFTLITVVFENNDHCKGQWVPYRASDLKDLANWLRVSFTTTSCCKDNFVFCRDFFCRTPVHLSMPRLQKVSATLHWYKLSQVWWVIPVIPVIPATWGVKMGSWLQASLGRGG